MHTNDGFVLRRIYGEYLLMPVHVNEAGNEIVSLNEVGADIWELAEKGYSEKEIVKYIGDAYCLEDNSVEINAVRNFIAILYNKKLLYP